MNNKEKQLNNMRLIDANKLLKEVRENKELFEKERVYLEGLLLNAETYNQVGHKMATAEGFITNPEWNKSGFKAGYKQAILDGHTNFKRQRGEWARHDEWVGGSYVGGFYHINCPCEDSYYSKWETNFCPNCGSPMQKSGEE